MKSLIKRIIGILLLLHLAPGIALIVAFSTEESLTSEKIWEAYLLGQLINSVFSLLVCILVGIVWLLTSND